MCIISVVIGAIGGVGAWLFRSLIGLLHNFFFLGTFQFAYEANDHTVANPWGIGIIFVPVVGGLIVAWLVKTFAPEAKGHGVPEVIDAIHYQGGRIRPVVAAVKSLASAVCIGSGGSVGREGPIIQIGAAFGSTVGQMLNIPVRQRITLVATGAAAGIAATFNAPLGGVVFAIELLLISVNVRTLLPVSIATVTATYIGQAMLGTHPAFDLESLRTVDFNLQSPWFLLMFVPFGAIMGLASIVFVKGVYWSEDVFDKLPMGDIQRHCTGMFFVGLILYAMFQWQGTYYVQGIGYATIMDVLAVRLTDPMFLLFVCALKMVTTFLTIGSGGSGGVFSPALFVGATLGAAVGHIVQAIIPGFPIDVLMFSLAGMAAMVGASTGAVLTASVMLHEMTYDNNIVLPMIITTTIAYGVRKRVSPGSIYTIKLLRRDHVVPEGLQAALDDARNVSHVMSSEYHIVADDAQPIENCNWVRLIAHDGELVEVVDPTQRDLDLTDAKVDHRYVLVAPDEPLLSATRKMQLAHAVVAIATTSPDSHHASDVVGVLTLRELARYRAKLAELFD